MNNPLISSRRSALRITAAAGLAAALLLAGCNSPEAYKIQGDTRFDAGQDALAIENYELYLNERPGNEDARYNLARAYMRSNQPAQAASHMRVLHAQVPGKPQYTELLAESLLASGRRDELYRLLKSEAVEPQTMSDWMRLGQFALRQGDKDTAQVALLQAAKVDAGHSWEPHIALYDYYRSMGQKPEAIRRLRMAAWVAPLNAEVTRRIKESGEITGPSFALRPAEWDARTFESPTEPFNPFEKKPATETVAAPTDDTGKKP